MIVKLLQLMFVVNLIACSSNTSVSRSSKRPKLDDNWGKPSETQDIYNRDIFLAYDSQGRVIDIEPKAGAPERRGNIVKVTALKDTTLNGVALKKGNIVYAVKIDGTAKKKRYLLLPKYDGYVNLSLQNFYARPIGEKYFKHFNLITGEEKTTNFVASKVYYQDMEKKSAFVFLQDEQGALYFANNGKIQNQVNDIDFSNFKQTIDVQAITPVHYQEINQLRFVVRHVKGNEKYYQMYDKDGAPLGPQYKINELVLFYYSPIETGMDVRRNYFFMIKIDGKDDLYWPLSDIGTIEIPDNILGMTPLKYNWGYYNKSEFSKPESFLKWGQTAILWADENDDTYWTIYGMRFFKRDFAYNIKPKENEKWKDFTSILYFNIYGRYKNLSKIAAFITTNMDGKAYSLYLPPGRTSGPDKSNFLKTDFKSIKEAQEYVAETNKTNQATSDKAYASYVKWSNSLVDKNYVNPSFKEVVDKKTGKKRLVRKSIEELIRDQNTPKTSSHQQAQGSGQNKSKVTGPTGAIRDMNYSRLNNSRMQTQRLKSMTRSLRSRR